MIYINATILDDKPTGLGVYTKNILKYFDKNLVKRVIIKDNYYSTFITEFKYEKEKISTIKCKTKNNIASVFLRNYAFKKFIDNESKINNVILYSPTQHGVINNKIKQIITIHDLLPLLYPDGRIHQYIYYKYILPKVIKCSEKIITVSENTKKDIIKYYGVREDRIIVIYNGFDKPKYVNNEKSKIYVENKYKIRDYILMVGINYRYKNLHSVIYAYSDIHKKVNKKLVIVGDNNNKYGYELKKIVEKLNLIDQVIFLGYVPEEDKHYIYQASDLFIYPSLYEGFGLPVLEAMANRVPVICSNTSSLVEVANNVTITFNPHDIKEIKEAILKMINLGKQHKVDIIEKYNKNIERFSWEKCVTEIQSILKNI